MSFMRPQIVEFSDVADEFSESPDLTYGFAWRLSAPGYLDCTDWVPAKTVYDAAKDMLDMYGDEFDDEDFGDIESYLQEPESAKLLAPYRESPNS